MGWFIVAATASINRPYSGLQIWQVISSKDLTAQNKYVICVTSKVCTIPKLGLFEYSSIRVAWKSDRAEIRFLFERLEKNRVLVYFRAAPREPSTRFLRAARREPSGPKKSSGPKTPSGPKVPSSPGVLSSLKLECFEHFRICLFTG